MNYILFDNPTDRQNLLPLTFTRPVANIRIGILTIAKKWEKQLKSTVSYLTMDYLQNIQNLSEISCNNIETRAAFSSLLSSAHYTEARLIHSLEEKEIGRPSTFSAIIEKIKEREYVKKQNIQGESIECVEYTVSIPEKKNISK